MNRNLFATVLAYLLLPLSTAVLAEEPTERDPVWKGFGVFGSLDDDTSAGKYYQYEAFLIRRLPWRWTPGNAVIEPKLFVGGGWYHQDDDTLEYLTIGPVLQIGREDLPVRIELGVRPGWLFDYDSPGRNFGGNFTFFDHVGILWQPNRSFTLGYRFQHMSNASIYERNPGINMHLLDLRISF